MVCSESLASSSSRDSCLEHYCLFVLGFFLHENIPVMCQANNTQRILLHCPAFLSSEVLAVCGVNNTVRCALKVTVGTANDKRNMLTFHKSAAWKPLSLCILCLPWKIWVTGLVSKVFSITLLSSLMSVSISTIGMFTLCGWGKERGRWCAKQNTA